MLNDTTLCYQNIMDISGQIIFREILSRFKQSECTQNVICTLENTGDIIDHDLFVLQQVVLMIKHGYKGPRISVNISGKTTNVYQQIIDLIYCNKIGEKLILELTETTPSNSKNLLALMVKSKALGVKLAFDDVNENPNILTYLEIRNPDILKVSRRQKTILSHWFQHAPMVNHIVIENIESVATAQNIWQTYPEALLQGYALHKPENIANLR